MYPTQPPPPQGYPPQGYPPQGYPPQGYPPQGYPPPPPGYGYPQPGGNPPPGYPPQGYPQHGYPPQQQPQQQGNKTGLMLCLGALAGMCCACCLGGGMGEPYEGDGGHDGPAPAAPADAGGAD